MKDVEINIPAIFDSEVEEKIKQRSCERKMFSG